ncbi:C40 family peptidase [Streptomyces sp. PTM05]|uniref:C40 family peptidase n=1 Tax=Streptantibioticus parmotrematis TaxID=2873249 RepID=A0ABS7QSS0_9ACTN|nr:NlpC/P60 family protein [Streptantibioticus parmotrematis]MBY8886235.1 C40 family peptidase [Streptantibioticus parmotrematis]
MASHRRPKPASRTRVTVLTATAAAAVALSTQAANADPKPSVSDVKSQVDSLNQQAEQATEKYDGAQEKQSQLQQQVNDLQNKVAREQASLNKLADNFGELASAQYRTGGIDPSLQLFLSSDPDSYLDKATMLDQLSGTQADELKQIEAQKRVLDQERAEASAKLAQLDSTRKALQQNKQDVQNKLSKAQNLLNTLTASQRASIENGGSVSDPSLGDSKAASARAQAALDAAKTRIGDPYVYGATGPGSFDCSGLTQWAYAQAGISLPRTSQEQEDVGQHLTESELQPGDLVIMYGGDHVGLYAGNGIILHAPHTGASVRYEPLSDMPFDFGVRVG